MTSLLVAVLLFPGQVNDLTPIPKTPVGATELLAALPFKLADGYKFDWTKEPMIVNSGTIIVLKVDRALVQPRNSAEPVLYAGDRTVQRLNQGHVSGTVIGIVPGEVDLSTTPIWFGHPDLPERVDAKKIREARALADEAKIRPFSAETVKANTRGTLESENLAALLRDRVAPLVLEFSPQEKDLAETWRLPVAKSRLRNQ